MSQQSRMFYIMNYLSMHQEATAPFLAEKLEVSVRTIYRDLDNLSGLGFPVYAQNGRNGGIRLLENHQIPATFVTEEEQEVLLSGLENLTVTEFGGADELSVKLSSLFKRSADSWLAIDYSSWRKSEEKEYIELLTTARKQKKCVFLTYENSQGVVSEREVAPNKLFFKQHNWYLSGYCYLKEEHRIFKLKRIRKLTPSERPLDSALLTENYMPEYSYQQLVFIIEADQLPRMQEELSNLQVEPMENRLKVSTWLATGEWLFSYLLSYGAALEVLEPKELRERIKEEIQNYRKLYE
ncbi:YafY family transcriptional regulator [Enterococcus sp. BWM-S5]|uniref:YafY family transcriptional regulator n=1 Tax=Enterococcus larvae TaxID=2794352 RepID=A0ABS4CMH2_9ENTE|nr:YafY family protein [Enterococcus larvae]MBP1047645.1 YafY family transcriptional regulator [Enterococcus larvae]